MKTENTKNDNLLEINLETVQNLPIINKLDGHSEKFPTITKNRENPTITEKFPTASTGCVEIYPTITRL